jgi:plasmid stabilization system protein ParE
LQRASFRKPFIGTKNKNPALGSEFVRSIEVSIQLIRRHPKIFPAVHKNIRQAVIRRFPYSIFYLVEVDKIVVLAIFHTSRNPSIWQQRQPSSVPPRRPILTRKEQALLAFLLALLVVGGIVRKLRMDWHAPGSSIVHKS